MERGVPGRKTQNRKEHKNIPFWKKTTEDQCGRNVVEKRKLIQKAGSKASTDNI